MEPAVRDLYIGARGFEPDLVPSGQNPKGPGGVDGVERRTGPAKKVGRDGAIRVDSRTAKEVGLIRRERTPALRGATAAVGAHLGFGFGQERLQVEAPYTRTGRKKHLYDESYYSLPRRRRFAGNAT